MTDEEKDLVAEWDGFEVRLGRKLAAVRAEREARDSNRSYWEVRKAVGGEWHTVAIVFDKSLFDDELSRVSAFEHDGFRWKDFNVMEKKL